ncbi:MAG TPA: BON domain-containing protein [Candidatus Sulfotelmatobacter sp.]|nr:BON domain-containing protein [Candidatus Sulfotelmatobacter sp.]
MRYRLLFIFAAVVCVSVTALAAPSQNQSMPSSSAQRNQASPRDEERITREIRHELLMLPYFGVFDYIAYKVEGYNVTLLGQVVRPSLKSDAENSVKHIEGIEHVDNQIEVLPPSSMDDGLRIRLFRAIYDWPALQKYELGVQKPIRIIVKNGHVTLEGVVDNQADKDAAGIRANTVPGIFSVTNNLQVVPNS